MNGSKSVNGGSQLIMALSIVRELVNQVMILFTHLTPTDERFIVMGGSELMTALRALSEVVNRAVVVPGMREVVN